MHADAGRAHGGTGYAAWCAAALFAVVLATLFVWYAEPIKDGDLWFQMAYGRWLLEHGTLVTDHSVFSWTPTDNTQIYCAWVSQVLLFALYQLGSLPALFALRYGAFLLFVALVGLHARRTGAHLHPLTWLVCLAGLLMAQSAAIIKPELFSFVLMTLSVALWWKVRASSSPGLCYAFPALVLVWVNTHGGVVFGAVFLGLIALGEALNGLFSPDEALPHATRRHFFTALALCVPALFATPYGWRYPYELFMGLVVRADASVSEFRTVGAYQTIFHPLARWHHFIEYLAFAAACLVVLGVHRWRKARPDWTLVLANLGMALIYCQFLRTTYFWAVVFTFSAVSLIHPGPVWLTDRRSRAYPFVLAAVVLLGVSVSGRAVLESRCRPLNGFGISHYNPVEEAAFIREHLSGLRLGNDYDSGGYLLWALHPDTEVFIDARYFPYKPWYREYTEFLYGRDQAFKDAFVKKYDPDIWCLIYDFPRMDYFLKSADFRLVHYGPSACIFARSGLALPADLPRVSPEVFSVDMFQAIKVIVFCTAAGELDTGYALAKTLQRSPVCPRKNAAMAGALTGLSRALVKAGRTAQARECMERTLEMDPRSIPALNGLALIASAEQRYEAALSYLRRVRDLDPGNADVYYNMACVLARKGMAGEALDMLRAALARGFARRDLLLTDPDLDSLRGMEGFRPLVPE
jgi:tetratricopeptide (TPR) repeat protein